MLRHNGPNIGFRGKYDVKIIEANLFFFLLLLKLRLREVADVDRNLTENI